MDGVVGHALDFLGPLRRWWRRRLFRFLRNGVRPGVTVRTASFGRRLLLVGVLLGAGCGRAGLRLRLSLCRRKWHAYQQAEDQYPQQETCAKSAHSREFMRRKP